MTVVKAFRYTASVHWQGGRLVRANARGKPALEIATPPEFKGGLEGVWSPEELLAASAAACFAVTLAAVAEASRVDLASLDVDGVANIERDSDGIFQLVAIELTVEAETENEHVSTLRRVVEETKRRCIVTGGLAVPVHVRLVIASAAGAAVGK